MLIIKIYILYSFGAHCKQYKETVAHLHDARFSAIGRVRSRHLQEKKQLDIVVLSNLRQS